MNKVGLLEKNMLELILTIIGLLLILSAVVYGFNKITANQILRNAQTSLDKLESSANSLEEGDSIVVKLPGLCKGGDDKACDWFITGWSKDDTNALEKYTLKNIICVCQGSLDNAHYFESAKMACQRYDLCKELDEASQIVISPNSLDDNIGTLRAAYKRDVNSNNKLSYIPFSSNLIEVKISKDNGVVTFTKQ